MSHQTRRDPLPQGYRFGDAGHIIEPSGDHSVQCPLCPDNGSDTSWILNVHREIEALRQSLNV